MFNIYGAGLYPTTVGTDWTTNTVTDFGASPTDQCWAINLIGQVEQSGTILNYFQESDDPVSGFTDIPGAAFSVVSSAPDMQVLSFTRTKRYVRAKGDVTGLNVVWTLGIFVGDQPPDMTDYLQVQPGSTLTPVQLTAAYPTWNGGGVVFIPGSSLNCWAIMMTGDGGDNEGVLTAKMQESDDIITWTDIPGATFAPFTGPNQIQLITFARTKAQVRVAGGITGSGFEIIACAVAGLLPPTYIGPRMFSGSVVGSYRMFGGGS